MVLVTADFRRRGIATRLVDACLDAATRRGLTSWLDATPAGASVYGPLGFTPALQLRRLRLVTPAKATTTAPPTIGNLDALIARDTDATGFERSALLTEFAARPGSCILSNGGAGALVRNGRTARHIGPVLADRGDQALKLVEAIVGSEPGPWSMPYFPRTSFWTGSSARAGTSSGRFSACALAKPPARPRNCRSPSPVRNLDRKCCRAS
jgi:hypothetical protein